MNLRNLAALNAVVALLYGIGLAAVPDQFLGVFEITADPQISLVARFVGALSIGYAVLDWLARDDLGGIGLGGGLRGAVIWANVVASALLFVISLFGQLNNLAGPLGWANVVLSGLFAAGWVYLGVLTGPARS
jgi:hypothetical protein